MPAWAVLTIYVTWVIALALLFSDGLVLRGRAAVVALGAFCVGAVWTAIQALPLPCAWVKAVNPDLVHGLEATFALLPGQGTQCGLSYDPGRTQVELVKVLCALAACVAGVRLAGLGARRDALRAIALAPLVLAMVTAAHWAWGAHEVFGFYEPRDLPPGAPVSPIINPNALGGFLAAHLPLQWVCFLRASGRSRPAWGAAILLSLVLAAMVLSRGASAIMVLGSLWCARASYAGETRGRPRGRLIAAAGIVGVVAVCLLAAYTILPSTSVELESGRVGKLEIAGRVFALAGRHPYLGVGRGGFAAAFAQSENAGGRVYFAENVVAQYLSEWGGVVGGSILVALGLAWALAFRDSRQSLLRRAALVALALAALQNLVDLALELTAIYVHWAFVLGVVAGRRLPSNEEGAGRLGGGVWRAPVAIVGLGMACLWVLAPAVRADVFDSTLEMQAALDADDVPRLDELTPASVRRHPLEPNVILLGAEHMVRHHPTVAGPWVNRALSLVPQWWQPHVYAANWLWAAGRKDQAMLEISEAAREPEADLGAIAWAVCAIAPDANTLERSFPPDPAREQYLVALAGCLPRNGPAQQSVDAYLVKHYPWQRAARFREAERRLRSGDPKAALLLVDGVEDHDPNSLRAREIRYRSWLALGQYSRVAKLCVEARGDRATLPLHVRCAEAFAQQHQVSEMRAEIEAMRRLVWDDDDRLSQVELRLARLEETMGNPRTALLAYVRSYELKKSAVALKSIERLARSLKQPQRAAWARRERCRLLGAGCGEASTRGGSP